MGCAQVFGNDVLSQLKKLYLTTVESVMAIAEAERERNKTTRDVREEDRGKVARPEVQHILDIVQIFGGPPINGGAKKKNHNHQSS